MNDSYSEIPTIRSVAETMPGGDGMIEAQRAADGQHPVADVELFGIAPLGLHLQVRLDLEDGQIGLGVGTDQSGRHVVARAEPHHDLDRRP